MAVENSLGITQAGIVAFDGAATFSGRTITAGSGVTITNGSGVGGNPTISASGSVPISFVGNTGTATPALGVLTVTGSGALSTSGSGSTLALAFSVAGAPTIVTTLGTGSGNAVGSSNTITLTGANGVSTTGSGATVTIGFSPSGSPTLVTSIATQSGTVTPSGNSFTANGANGLLTSGSGATLTITGSNATTSTPGVASFSSTYFSVSGGVVSLLGSAVGQTITGNSGGALSPSSGNWNILGASGITTSGSGSTLTINGIAFIDQGSSTVMATNTGYYATASITLTTPASPAQGDELIVIVDTSSTVTVSANAGQKLRIGNLITLNAGSTTNTAQGDSLIMRFRASTSTWFCVNEGNWNL